LIKREDPDNRIQNRLLSILRHRDQEMAQKKQSDCPDMLSVSDISPISVLPGITKIEETIQEEIPLEEILEYLGKNYQPVQDFFTMVDNFFFDKLCSELSASSQVIYLHLYRLSHGWNKPYCRIGRKTLADRTNLSKNTIVRSIKELKEKNYIKELAWDQDGTIYQVLLPREIIGGSISGILPGSIPKMGIEYSSIPKIGIPKSGIPKIDTPKEYSKQEDIQSIEYSSIPKSGIPKMGIPKEYSKQEDIQSIEYSSIPKSGIPKMGIPKSGIPKMGIPKSVGIPKMGIPPDYIDNKNDILSQNLSIDSGSIPKIDPIKYNIYKKTLSLKTWDPPPNFPPEEREYLIKGIIENFYKKLNQSASSEKKKSGERKVNELLEDGYSLSDINFAAEWVAENKSGAAPQSFALVPHCIDQALKERNVIYVKENEKEQQIREIKIKRKEELEKDEGLYLDEYYNTLDDNQKELLKNEAVNDLEKTNPNFKKVDFMTDFLVQMKIREIVKNKFFNHKEVV
jgi:hypothetical protein